MADTDLSEPADPTESSAAGAKILVATDFSVNASLALDRAGELAKARGVPILLVHATAVDSVRASGSLLPNVPPEFEEKVRRACSEGLERLAQDVRSEGIAVETRLLDGPPAQTVVDLAAAESASLIVVGARGSTGFAHILLGRIAEEIVRLASCPVLTVHPSDAEPLEEIERVLVPYDFSAHSVSALDAAIDLLGDRASSVEIVLLHAIDIPMVLVPIVALAVAPSSLRAELAEKAQGKLDEIATRLRKRGLRVRVETGTGDPESVITNTAGKESIDLIVMGKRGTSKLNDLLLGSVAQRVVQHAPCPVLTVSAKSRDDAP